MWSLEGKRVVVTGGTGSLGSSLVHRLLSGTWGTPGKVLVFSRDEAKQHALRLQYFAMRQATDEVIYQNSQRLLDFRIGDIRNFASVAAALSKADVVFHAAALKQVPTCEYFPDEAVQTNVLGPRNLVRAIHELRLPVETVIGISTDKACKPVNVMGMTKALQERILVQANLDCPGTRFVCVRYGNVLCSRGSVIPLFQEQIRSGGPVTITSADMTRFLLTLDQAVDAVLTAYQVATAGQIYVPRIPSATIPDIVQALLNGRTLPVHTIGTRPGEKLHEILISEEESPRSIPRDHYFVIDPLLPELHRSSEERLTAAWEYSSADALMSAAELRMLLQPLFLQDASWRQGSLAS